MGRARLPVKGARGPSQGKAIAQARWDNLAIQPRTVQSSADPKSHRKEGQKRYMTRLERKSENIQGKLPLLPFNTLHLTEPYSSAFTTTPNDFGYGLMGQVSVLERLALHVDEGQRTQASIKGKVSHLEKGLGKMAKNQSLPAHLQERETPWVKMI